MKTRILTSMAFAGGLIASAITGVAQTSATSPSRDPGNVSSNPGTTPNKPANTGDQRPAPSNPANVPPVPMPVPRDVTPPVPIPPAGANNGGGAPMRPAPDLKPGNPNAVVPLPAPTRGPVTLVARPAGPPERSTPGSVTPPAGPVSTLPVAVTPLAGGSGVVVFASDIVKVDSAAAPTPIPAEGTSGVTTLVQQFDVQRTQQLAARNLALEQLRTATPEQRSAIIAELQSGQVQQAAEQRELARELRNEMRALREQRKGN